MDIARDLHLDLMMRSLTDWLYDEFDEPVRFLKGWFRDRLPNAPIERVAVMRLDGDQ
jgi:hypothetical protein